MPAGETADWAKDIAHIDCCTTTRLQAPVGSKTLIFTPDARQEVVEGRLSMGGLRQYPIAHLEPPAMASWSPNSRAFFISDGEGSGQTSTFRLFKSPDNGGPSELQRSHRDAVAAYPKHVACPGAAFDPEVWGLGWDKGGARVYVLVQSSVHEPCGRPDDFMVMAVDAETGALVAQYDTAEATEKFASLIPANVLSRGVTAP